MRRLIIDVKSRDDGWVTEWRGFGRSLFFWTKREAVYRASGDANLHASLGGLAQVVIRKLDGRIQSERTYPRSSDPRRRKG